MPVVSTSSSSTQAQLFPSSSSITATKSKPHIPISNDEKNENFFSYFNHKFKTEYPGKAVVHPPLIPVIILTASPSPPELTAPRHPVNESRVDEGVP
ncbi:hypothetical protein TNIN_14291 [Trichonephila inaurata madagascariensis]|uniref:Uncharacterized protein n=1 Tax=Trichonephila inaurata madagascariensis TaxID=2747483 RepID=A0A8X6Y5G5_9ARAC|nr:hypothetical protein TNIN_14291 [Trichonephila inaurata madagascariensis]